MLKLINIRGGYREREDKWILHGVNLEIGKNETVAILGKNGAGKSTLAKSIVNLLPYKEGQVLFDGKDISTLSTEKMSQYGISYFAQGGRVFPQLTVIENLRFAGRHLTTFTWQRQLDELAHYFDLLGDQSSPQLWRAATWLSGGQRHQLALAMALFNCPRLLILDEPTAGLSPANINQVYRSLHRLKIDKKMSILLIEQNVKQAKNFADREEYLKQGSLLHYSISERL